MPESSYKSKSLKPNFIIGLFIMLGLVFSLISCKQVPQVSLEDEVNALISMGDRDLAEKKLLLGINSSKGKRRLELMNKLADMRTNLTPAQQEGLIDEIVNLAREVCGAESLEFANAKTREAQVLFRQRQFIKSAEAWTQAGEIFDKLGDKYLRQQMDCVSGRIAGECATGKCVQEIELYKRLLALRRRVYGDDNQQTMIAVMLLGETYSKAGRYEDALEQFNALAKWSKTRSQGEQTSANLNLARTYIHMKDFANAEPLLKSSLEFAETHQTNKRVHPMHVPALKAYLLFYDGQKKYKDELVIARKILDMNESQMGPKHPQLPTTLMLYADALEKAGKKKEAVAVQKRIRDIEMGTDREASKPSY